jgi:hypothetical protein
MMVADHNYHHSQAKISAAKYNLAKFTVGGDMLKNL